jgi:hypothetical protein
VVQDPLISLVLKGQADLLVNHFVSPKVGPKTPEPGLFLTLVNFICL